MCRRWTSLLLAITLALGVSASGSRRSATEHAAEHFPTEHAAEPGNTQQHNRNHEGSCEDHAVLYGQVQQDLLPFRLAGITKANLIASLQWCATLRRQSRSPRAQCSARPPYPRARSCWHTRTQVRPRAGPLRLLRHHQRHPASDDAAVAEGRPAYAAVRCGLPAGALRGHPDLQAARRGVCDTQRWAARGGIPTTLAREPWVGVSAWGQLRWRC